MDEGGHLATAGGAAEEAAAVLRVGVRAAGALPLRPLLQRRRYQRARWTPGKTAGR